MTSVPFPGPGYPFTGAGEQEWLEALVAAAAAPHRYDDAVLHPEVQRHYATLLVTALRSSTPLPGLLGLCPGVSPARLLRVYQDLEAQLARTGGAWDEVVGQASVSALAGLAPQAARLMPVPMRHLLLGQLHAPHRYPAVVVQVADRVALAGQRSRLLEEALADPGRDQAARAAAGRALFQPPGSGLWCDPWFLPSRVGQLDPRRVAALLGEA